MSNESVFSSGLEVDVSGELEVAGPGVTGDAADLAEGSLPEDRCGSIERDLVPDVDAVDLEDEVTDFSREVEALFRSKIQVLGAWRPQLEGRSTGHISVQVDGRASDL